MQTRGNNTKHAMHQYLPPTRARVHELVQECASVSLHHCKKQTKAINTEHQEDFLFTLFNPYLSSSIKIFPFAY